MSTEKKYTQEEIKAIVDEEIGKANLAMGTDLKMDEMETVAGGGLATKYGATDIEYPYPKTHADIDARWNVIQRLKETYGNDIALDMAIKMNLYAGAPEQFAHYGIDVYRRRMHDGLDGKLSATDMYSAH